METERTGRVTFSGPLDSLHARTLGDELPDPAHFERVVIDCSNATFVDSAFIGGLMRYRREFIAAGRNPLEIVIIVNPAIRRMFEISGVARAMTILNAP